MTRVMSKTDFSFYFFYLFIYINIFFLNNTCIDNSTSFHFISEYFKRVVICLRDMLFNLHLFKPPVNEAVSMRGEDGDGEWNCWFFII